MPNTLEGQLRLRMVQLILTSLVHIFHANLLNENGPFAIIRLTLLIHSLKINSLLASWSEEKAKKE